MRIFAAFLFIPFSVYAQTIQMPMDSPWGTWPLTVKYTLSAQALRKNATTGVLEAISGQRVALDGVKLLQPSLTVTFPGQKSSAMTVAGLRLFHQASGTGWDMPEHAVNVAFAAPISVPAGQKLACLYEMPVATIGKLTCAVGSVVAIPPPPPPATGASPDGTSVPPAPQIVDSTGAVWTLAGGVVYRNGVAGPVYQIKITYKNNTVYAQNDSGNWWSWTGSTWISTSAP